MDNEQLKKRGSIWADISGYVDGAYIRKYLSFPTTRSKLKSTIKKFGVGSKQPIEIEKFSVYYDAAIRGLETRLPRTPDFNELNYLASIMEQMSEKDKEIFAAVICTLPIDKSTPMSEVINTAMSLDCFEFYPGIRSLENYGEVLADIDQNNFKEKLEHLKTSNIPEDREFALYVQRMGECLNHKEYGRKAMNAENGRFSRYGYLYQTASSIPVKYSGPQDIPVEYQVTELPAKKISILETLAAVKSMEQTMGKPEKVPQDKPAPDR